MATASSPDPGSRPRCIVVMGVSGSGKSTLAAALAQALGRVYVEGDDFHSAENVAKMAAGQALTDADRGAWLSALAERLRRAQRMGEGVVMSCSALKRDYRDVLRGGAPRLSLVFLEGSAALIGARMRQRQDHYMPPTLLDSQFAALEPPGPDEGALRLDVAQPVETLLRETLDWLQRESIIAASAVASITEEHD